LTRNTKYELVLLFWILLAGGLSAMRDACLFHGYVRVKSLLEHFLFQFAS